MNKKIYEGSWYTFYWANRFDISYETCGYFDSRPRIIFSPGFFSLTIHLPFRNKKWEDECDSPKWGIPTTIYVEEREWRPKWLKFTKLFSLVRRTIDVHFSREVGARKGSWKGGTIGCGYDMKPDETPLDCLKRMEVERNF